MGGVLGVTMRTPRGSTESPGAIRHERSEPEGRGAGMRRVILPSAPSMKKPALRRFFYGWGAGDCDENPEGFDRIARSDSE